MKVILRDPPLMLLLMAIALDLPVKRAGQQPAKQGWVHRFLEWRNSLARRA